MRSPGPIGGDLLARRYRLIDRIGTGGMSVVWRARDEVLDRLVAVKWLGTELADDSLYRDLVRREAWATARIRHPAVAAVYDYGEVVADDGGSLGYVVMEMLDGESLADRLRRGPLPWREALAIAAELADALATAHEHGVVHRDVSPDNVMLTSSGLRVFDFGIAAPIGEPDEDATGSTFGTPAYVAPERLDGQPAQTATDVYSLGVLLHVTLAGRPPFPEDSWDLNAPLSARPAPRLRVRGLPAAVTRLCRRCLAYDPAARPAAREVARLLSRCARRWTPVRVAVTGAAALLLAAGIGFGAWSELGGGYLAGAPSAALASPTASLGGTGTHGSGGPTSGAPAPTRPAAEPSAPAPTSARPPTAPPRPTPAVTTPAPAPLSVAAAIGDLRATIDAAVPTGLAEDVAIDLRNTVDNLAATLSTTPQADVSGAVRDLRHKITVRSTEKDQFGQVRVSQPTCADLLAAVDRLNAALGYPPLA